MSLLTDINRDVFISHVSKFLCLSNVIDLDTSLCNSYHRPIFIANLQEIGMVTTPDPDMSVNYVWLSMRNASISSHQVVCQSFRHVQIYSNNVTVIYWKDLSLTQFSANNFLQEFNRCHQIRSVTFRNVEGMTKLVISLLQPLNVLQLEHCSIEIKESHEDELDAFVVLLTTYCHAIESLELVFQHHVSISEDELAPLISQNRSLRVLAITTRFVGLGDPLLGGLLFTSSSLLLHMHETLEFIILDNFKFDIHTSLPSVVVVIKKCVNLKLLHLRSVDSFKEFQYCCYTTNSMYINLPRRYETQLWYLSCSILTSDFIHTLTINIMDREFVSKVTQRHAGSLTKLKITANYDGGVIVPSNYILGEGVDLDDVIFEIDDDTDIDEEVMGEMAVIENTATTTAGAGELSDNMLQLLMATLHNCGHLLDLQLCGLPLDGHQLTTLFTETSNHLSSVCIRDNNYITKSMVSSWFEKNPHLQLVRLGNCQLVDINEIELYR